WGLPGQTLRDKLSSPQPLNESAPPPASGGNGLASAGRIWHDAGALARESTRTAETVRPRQGGPRTMTGTTSAAAARPVPRRPSLARAICRGVVLGLAVCVGVTLTNIFAADNLRVVVRGL